MLNLIKSHIAQRVVGGFLAGSAAIIALQPPEGALPIIAALKSAAGVA